MLDEYQRHYHLYDWALGELSPLLCAKYPDATAIDIGANVGDTAALLCSRQPIPVLCVEGHPQFLPYLRRNVERLPDGIEIAECLIGTRSGAVPVASLATVDGTATLTGATGSAATVGDVPVRTLADVLAAHPRFRRARLLKTDTDGSDFQIVVSALDVLSETRPVLFFEYFPTLRANGAREARETIAALAKAGYHRFLVYDNFGHLMASVRSDFGERFLTLDHYLFSHLYFGRAIYYFDVFAFGPADGDLCSDLESTYRLLMESTMHKDGKDF